MDELENCALSLRDHLRQHGLKLVTAESCTGGWIAQVITSIPGSSAWFDRGFVTYSNDAKHESIGVPIDILENFGAVSVETAKAMAEGAIAHSLGDVAISVTGIAGPDGGTAEKPVGTVCFGFARKGHATRVEKQLFIGNRHEVRLAAVRFALTHAVLIRL